MEGKLKILFVEDAVRDAEIIWHTIEKGGIAFERLLVDNKKDFLNGLKSFKPDIIISDYSLPQFDGMNALLLRNKKSPSTPFILVTGSINEEVAVECMKAGANDYILKGNLSRLVPALMNSIEKIKLSEEKSIAEKALRRADERLKSLYKVAPAGIGVVKNRILIEVNPTVCRMTGYKMKELIGSSSLILYPDKKEFDFVGQEKYRQIDAKGLGTVETRWKRKDGTIINIILASTYLDLNDLDQGVIFTATDITDRKRTEIELQKSEGRFRHVSSTISDISYSCKTDKDGTFSLDWMTGAAERITGFSIAEIKKANCWGNLVIDEDINIFKLNVTGLIAGSSGICELRLRKKNGEIVWVESFAECTIEKEPDECLVLYGGLVDITERKRTEEMLRKSELGLQKAQSIAHVGNWELDLSKKTITASDEAYRIYGFSMENREIALETVQNVPLPQYRAALNEALDRLLKYNETYEAEFQIKSADNGAIKWLYSKAELLNVVDSEQVKIIGVIQDITDRKKFEEAVSESEKKYRNIFENVQDLYYETTFDGTITEVSPSIRILSHDQYSRDDLIGKSMFEFYADPDRRQFLLSAINEKGDINDYEITLKNRDGSLVPCSLSAKVTFDAMGQPEKIIGSMRDITARKEFEEILRQERNLLRTLVDNIPDPVSIKDSDCRYILNNKAHLQVIGVSNQEDATGKTSFDFFRNEEASEFYAEDEKIISTGEKIINKLERVIDKSTGSEHWYLTSKIPLTNNYGKPTHVLTVSHDITEPKKAEEELLKAKEKAEESDRLKTAFLHNISHEIRTPMNSIVGFSALLGEPDLDLQIQKSYTETIMQSSNHLLSIITDIIDISNIEANIIKIARNEINVNFILNSLCNQFLLKASEKKIKLICDTELSDSEALVTLDNTKLTQILTNLISNAIKFTEEGSVRVLCKKVNDYLELSVADTGIGIPAGFHTKVFDRFYQVQSTGKRLYEGTGLGLAISKAYVELMGGKIWLMSEPGEGTTFCFTIPYEKQTIKPSQDIDKPEYNAFAFKELKTILVAEDVDSNFKLIAYFLSKANIKILRAFNGKEAVEIALSEKNIDLILMDIKMPEMDGYTATRLIREVNKKIPIIAQTAYADDKERAIKNGCNGFISKPFDKQHLLKVISEFI